MQQAPAFTLSTLVNWLVAGLAGLSVLILVIWLMSELITPSKVEAPLLKLLSIDFVNVQPKDATNNPLQEDLPPPPPLQPVKPEIPQDDAILLPMPDKPVLEHVAIDTPKITPDLSLPNLPTFAMPAPSVEPVKQAKFDEDLFPIMTNDPIYPRSAKRRRIEGWVNVSFTINVDGRTENITVLAADPEGLFENATIAAIQNWRYQPQMLAGKATAREVVQTIKFELK